MLFSKVWLLAELALHNFLTSGYNTGTSGKHKVARFLNLLEGQDRQPLAVKS